MTARSSSRRSIGWSVEAGRGFYVLDEWQKYCIRGILSEDSNARLCAFLVLLIVPRQNGKGAVLGSSSSTRCSCSSCH